MKSTDLYFSFNEVDDDILERSEKCAAHKVIPLRRRVVMAVAAVLVVVVLMGAAAVVKNWDSVQNWVAYRWENSTGEQLSGYQTGIIESYSQKIGVSKTVNGVTVTAESAMLIDGRLDVMLHVDGIDFPNEGRTDIDYYEVQMNSDPNAAAGFSEFGYDNGTLIIPLNAFSNIDDNERYVKVTILLKDFISFNTREVTNAGEWKLEFTLENESFDVIELPDTEVMAYYTMDDYFNPENSPVTGDMPITITNVELTAMGISFEFEYEHGAVWDEDLQRSIGMKDIHIWDGDTFVYAVLDDGTEVKSKYGQMAGTTRDVTDPIQHETCTLSWPAPIDIDEVVEIHIGDTVIPVK